MAPSEVFKAAIARLKLRPERQENGRSSTRTSSLARPGSNKVLEYATEFPLFLELRLILPTGVPFLTGKYW